MPGKIGVNDAHAMGEILEQFDPLWQKPTEKPSGPPAKGLGMEGITSFADSGHGRAALDSGAPRRAPLPSNNPFRNMGDIGKSSNNPFRNMGDVGTRSHNPFIAQLGSEAFHAASHFAPPGPISTGLHAAGDVLAPSALGGGDPTTQMGAMQADFRRQQNEMTRLNNENTLAAAVAQQSQALTSALASVGNKGASNIADAAKGQ